jgi:hypothetical protein
LRIGLISREYPPETATGGTGIETHGKAHAFAPDEHTLGCGTQQQPPPHGSVKL